MPRPSAKLTNCYVPLPLPDISGKRPLKIHGEKDDASSSANNTNAEATGNTSLRDGEERQNHGLRQLRIETGVTDSLGSALIELGHTKVLTEVDLTTTDATTQMNASVEEGTLQVQVQYLPNVGVHAISQRAHCVTPLDSTTISFGKLRAEITTMETDLSAHVSSAIEPTILLASYPKCVIRTQVTVLQDDGSSLSACICAASIALVEARVEVVDMVTSCTVVAFVDRAASSSTINSTNSTNSSSSSSKQKKGDANAGANEKDIVRCLADPTRTEASQSSATVVLAMMPNHKEVTLWNQSGGLNPDMSDEAINLCRGGCRTMHKFMREHLVS